MLPDAPLTPPRLATLDASWSVPGSKSLTNRALPLAALAAGRSRLHNPLASDDTRHMCGALRQLGIAIDDSDPACWLVDGGRDRLRAPSVSLWIGNSGTSVRFLSALACLVDGAVTLDGDAHMRRRPIGDLVQALRDLGVAVDCASGCPPLTVHGGRLPGGRIAMPGDRSSQYFSALLLAGSAAEAPIAIDILGDLVSRPYLAMTCASLAAFGGRAELGEDLIRVEARPLRPTAFAIEADASAASYPLALAVACRGRIAVPGLDRGSLQGDVAFADILQQTGARLDAGDGRLVIDARECLPHGVDVDMKHVSDTVMSLAAIAPLLAGPTTIRNIANIRIKETDRLAATVTELRRLGQTVTHGDDWLRIEPAPLRPATVACYDDHRMAMSFAVLGAATGAVTIADPACVSKTYPRFWDDLAQIYRQAEQEPGW